MRWIYLVVLICAAVNIHAAVFEVFQESGKVGLKNEQGVVLLPPAFEALGWSDGSFSVIGQITGYKLNGNWGLINLKKEFVTSAEYESLTFSGADRVIAVKQINGATRKAGSLTFSGEVTIPFQYDAITIHGLRAIVMNKVGIEYQFGLTDLSNKILIPLKYSSIYPVNSLRFAVGNDQNKFALFSDAGKQVTDFFIDSISRYHRNYGIIHSSGWKGIIDREGLVVAAPEFQDIKFNSDGTVQALTQDNWKILDSKNQVLKSFQADAVNSFQTDTYRITRSGQVGVIREDLHEVWPFEYDFIGPVLNGYVVARKNKKWGLLSVDQSVKLPFEYDSLCWDGNFVTAMTFNYERKQWWLVNVSLTTKSPKNYDFIKKWDNSFLVRRNGFEGLLDAMGKESVHCVYDSILNINGDQVLVKFKNHYGIITKDERWILAPQPNRVRLVNDSLYLEKVDVISYLKSFRGDIIYFSNNPISVRAYYLEEKMPSGDYRRISFQGLQISPSERNSQPDDLYRDGLRVYNGQGKFGFKDIKGRLRIPNRYDSVKSFSDRLAAFKLLGRWGYLDTDDNMVVHPTYDFAGDFVNGYAIVIRNRKAGLINNKGEVTLALQYDSVMRMGSYLKIMVNNKTGLAQSTGKMLIEPRFDYLQALPNGQVIVGLQGRYGVITFDGLSVTPIIYSSLEFDKSKNVYLARLPSEWTTLNLPKNE